MRVECIQSPNVQVLSDVYMPILTDALKPSGSHDVCARLTLCASDRGRSGLGQEAVRCSLHGHRMTTCRLAPSLSPRSSSLQLCSIRLPDWSMHTPCACSCAPSPCVAPFVQYGASHCDRCTVTTAACPLHASGSCARQAVQRVARDVQLATLYVTCCVLRVAGSAARGGGPAARNAADHRDRLDGRFDRAR